MSKSLDIYFKQAKNATNPESLFKEVELNDLLEKGGSTTSIKLKSSKYLRRFLMGIFATSIIITTMALLFNSNPAADKKIQNNAKAISSGSVNIQVEKSAVPESLVKSKTNSKDSLEQSSSNTKHTLDIWTDDSSTNNTIKSTKKDNTGSVKKVKMTKDAVSISSGRSTPGPDIVNPEKSYKDTYGKDIPGIIALDLNNEELRKLGIILTDSTCTFQTEFLQRIHPIPFRRNLDYRNQPEIKNMVAANYDTTGKELVVKERREINLTDNRIIEKLDSIQQKRKEILMPNGAYNNKSFYDRPEIWEGEEKMILKKSLIKYTGWDTTDYSKISPVWYGYTYRDNFRSMTVSIGCSPIHNDHSEFEYYNKNIRNFTEMIPIRIHLADRNTDSVKTPYTLNFMIFWFLPTKEFVEALPERYSEPLKEELLVLGRVNSGMMPIKEACKGFDNKESFFELCRLNSGALSELSLYPNPATNNNVTCGFTLTANRKITITIHDVSGKYIATIMKNESKKTDDYKIPINMEGNPKGIYLIAVSTDKGEQVVQRLILN